MPLSKNNVNEIQISLKKKFSTKPPLLMYRVLLIHNRCYNISILIIIHAVTGHLGGGWSTVKNQDVTIVLGTKEKGRLLGPTSEGREDVDSQPLLNLPQLFPVLFINLMFSFYNCHCFCSSQVFLPLFDGPQNSDQECHQLCCNTCVEIYSDVIHLLRNNLSFA